jgi:hypothetical protein
MRRVLPVTHAEWSGMGEQDVDAAPVAHPAAPGAYAKSERAPAHLALRVLVGTLLVPDAAAEAGDAEAGRVDDPAVDVVAAARTRDRRLDDNRPIRVGPVAEVGVVVAGHVEQWDAGARHEILEVVERQVAAAEDQVRPQVLQRVAVKGLALLVGDDKDPRQR